MLNYEIFYCLLFLLILPNLNVALRTKNAKLNDYEWGGPWFPYNPKQKNLVKTPSLPSMKFEQQQPSTSSPHRQSDCDDGIHSIGGDFDPDDKRHAYNYLCLVSTQERKHYEPNMETEALLKFNFIPPAFVPSAKCLNESISYELDIPTYGPYRPIPAMYGEYYYLPPQRWLRNLAEGAIVMLYHPCAYAGQVTVLQNVLKSCLYRYIVTPSQYLSAERPLALLSWGKSLQLSVVDEKMVVQFIISHSKNGPLSYNRRDVDKEFEYRAALIAEAHLVTDDNDTEVCGYKET